MMFQEDEMNIFSTDKIKIGSIRKMNQEKYSKCLFKSHQNIK